MDDYIFQPCELVVLRDTNDDINFSRLYQVLLINNTKLTVKCINETPKNNTAKTTFEENETLVGRVFLNMEADLFKPYI